ncbi:proline-rich domain-containing protein [Streptomyces sp. NPDC059785]|uniref:proline-rich domain-containing protein n=1 Tax=Streptomyces sp. NPDC059785 TaxID=3346945 RepID=UPI00365AE044
MSYGDANNPYGPPQGQQPGYPAQGQPNYGYPQGGAPQQPGQPAYGYPQAPPLGQQGYGGYPGGAPTEIPGGVKAARVMLFVIGGLQVLGAILFALSAIAVSAAKNDETLKDDVQFQQLADYSSGVLWGFTVAVLIWGVLAIWLGVKVGSGANGIRVTIMVFAILTAILGIYPFIVIGLAHTVLAILVAVFVGKSDGAAWFNRPRY